MRRLPNSFVLNLSLLVLAFGLAQGARAGKQEKLTRPLPVQYNPIAVQDYLRSFHESPKKTMNTPLAKFDQNGVLDPSQFSPFDQDEELSRSEMLQARTDVRTRLCALAQGSCDQVPRLKSQDGRPSAWAAVNEKNQIQNFLYGQNYLRQLIEMESQNMLQAIASQQPWSDSFWPLSRGMIARRWADPGFPNSKNWIENYSYYLTMIPEIMPVNSLSPAEKYDLLVGDTAMTMTNTMWGDGKYYHDRGRTVPGWAGLCHGWAPAAIMAPNPLRAVTVYNSWGRGITFYPSDIKALASLAWGEAKPQIKAVGRRCETNNPKEDSVGRVIDENCFDVNPATWHMAIVNQLGVEKRSFVFDSTYDFQVWNYPIYAYQYQYFNPQTLATSKKLAGSMVRISDFTIDKFKTYRSPEARYVVGISMDVSYAGPVTSRRSPIRKASIHTVRYVYDLELDSKGEIVGGEWYSNFHPDFIWNLPADGKAWSDAEKAMPIPAFWDGMTPFPPELTDVAKAASARKQPLGTVVESLLRLAQPEAPN